MQCPVDGTVLAIAERRGIEVDYCPQCRGVWLDRGELDKLLDRAAEEVPEPPRYDEPRRDEPRRDEPRYEEPRYQPPRDRERSDPRYDPGYRKKKKKSFLSEFFEFD
ncbi:MAG TPA: zf-TFIIB domain-containing protein [Frankiaceae bacterium]|nr:zf-TFIIB domain-containing protein [Frankiaceae bacterium]